MLGQTAGERSPPSLQTSYTSWLTGLFLQGNTVLEHMDKKTLTDSVFREFFPWERGKHRTAQVLEWGKNKGRKGITRKKKKDNIKKNTILQLPNMIFGPMMYERVKDAWRQCEVELFGLPVHMKLMQHID